MDKPLDLREKMKSSWLIQRLQKPTGRKLNGINVDNLFSFGGGLKNGGLSDDAMGMIRGIFSFDYMGASEFEWGAVPNALRFLAEQARKGNISAGEIEFGKGQKVYYFSPKPYEKTVIERIKELRKDKMQLKEWCGLGRYFDSDSEYAKRNVGWLELDNGFAFFVDKDMFDKFCTLMGVNQVQTGESR